MQKAKVQTRRVAVMGTGSWGTTLAILSARQGLLTHLLARTEDEANTLREAGENKRFMPGHPFPESLVVTADAEEALHDCDMLLMVVPSQTMRSNIRSLTPHLGVMKDDAIIISAAKGLEPRHAPENDRSAGRRVGAGLGNRLGALSGRFRQRNSRQQTCYLRRRCEPPRNRPSRPGTTDGWALQSVHQP